MRHRSDRGSALTALVGLAMGVVCVIALATLFVAVKKQFGGDTGPVAKADPKKADPKTEPKTEPKTDAKPDPKADVKEAAKPDEPKPAEEEPQFRAAEVQATIEKSIGRINYVAIVAQLFELDGRHGDAARLRAQLVSEAGRVKTLIGMYERAKGTAKFDFIHGDDKITTFDGVAMNNKTAADGQMRLHVASIKALPRAAVAVLRGNSPVMFQISYREVPEGWLKFAMMLVTDDSIADAEPVKPDPVKPDPTKPPVKPDPVKPDPAKPPPKVDASLFGILLDPKQRTDVMQRGGAAVEFKKLAAANLQCAGWFSAARYFLEGDDAAWGVDKGPGAQALADYFSAAKIRDVATFDGERHLAAAGHLAPKAKEKKGEIFRIFALGHISDAALRLGVTDPRVRTAAESCGLMLTDDKRKWGDALGAATASILYWMGMNQQEKALEAYARYKSQSDAAVWFVAALAEFSLALSKQKYDWEGFHRKLMSFQKQCKDPDDAAYFEMLAETVRQIAGCIACRGGLSLACPLCQGTGQQDRLTCPSCKGSSAGAVDDRYRKAGQTNCGKCSNTGYVTGKCTKCNGAGKQECDTCHGKGWRGTVTDGSIWNLFNRTDCYRCQGSGSVIPGAACRCGNCRGLGYTITPKR